MITNFKEITNAIAFSGGFKALKTGNEIQQESINLLKSKYNETHPHVNKIAESLINKHNEKYPDGEKLTAKHKDKIIENTAKGFGGMGVLKQIEEDMNRRNSPQQYPSDKTLDVFMKVEGYTEGDREQARKDLIKMRDSLDSGKSRQSSPEEYKAWLDRLRESDRSNSQHNELNKNSDNSHKEVESSPIKAKRVVQSNDNYNAKVSYEDVKHLFDDDGDK